MTRILSAISAMIVTAILAAPVVALPDPAIVRVALSGPPAAAAVTAARGPVLPVPALRTQGAAPTPVSRPDDVAPLTASDFAARLAAIAARLDCLASGRPDHDC